MKAILICAGFGTRMYPLTRDVPKPLLPAGTTILDDLVDQLIASGPITQAIVVSNGRFADRFESWRVHAERRQPDCRFVVLDDGAQENAGRLGRRARCRLRRRIERYRRSCVRRGGG